MASRPLRAWRPLALLLGVVLADSPAHAASVYSTSQICTGNAAGDCETGPSVQGRGAMADMSRFWSAPGFAFAASTSIATDYASIGAFARASGQHTPPPESGPIFLGNVLRVGRSFGTFNDVLTAGEGGGSGFLRIPMHIAGATSIEWQNGGGSTSVVLSCVSSQPGSPYAIGQCQLTQLTFTSSETFDEVVNLDVPIVLGSPFEYTLNFNVTALTGYGYGNSVPFTGEAEIVLETLPFTGAVVLDATRQPIPDAPISLGESGFDYAPEPASLAGSVAALFGLLSLRGCPRDVAG